MKISNFGQIISNDVVSEVILREIKSAIKDNESVVIDFNGVYAMATYCAKQIFGALYVELGDLEFRRLINFSNETSDDIKAVISEGIMDAVAASHS